MQESIKKLTRIIVLLFFDVVFLSLSLYLSFILLFNGRFPQFYWDKVFQFLPVILSVKLIVFFMMKLYNTLWEYASIDELFQILGVTFIANVLSIFVLSILEMDFPNNIHFLMFIFDVFFIGGIRLLYRVGRRVKHNQLFGFQAKRVLIIGAGEAGVAIIKELINHPQLKSKAIGMIDDDKNKIGKYINKVPILGSTEEIVDITKNKKIDEIIIAMPSAPKERINEIVNKCKNTSCITKILPGIYELIDGKVNISQLREIQIEDLLGRKEIKLDIKEISEYIEDKVVLVSGGGGSIGSEICRQIIKFKPRQLIVSDIYENNAYELQQELLRQYGNLDSQIGVVIASVRDMKRMDEIFDKHRPDVVFHAAAHKHVPLMEDSPSEAVKNNVFGTINLIKCADKYKVKKFVQISTDKAVNPTNVMGTTKRICEMVIQTFNRTSKTDYVAVRFGNVLGSNGSVIPLFKRQIKEGGPVTVTDKNMIRYFMTIPEASRLVIQAGALATGGEIFVLDMGKPVKILNLAEDLISLSGLEPYKDIDIKITGLRPGEKLYEELTIDNDRFDKTSNEKIFIEKPKNFDYDTLKNKIDKLEVLINNSSDDNEIIKYLTEIVPTYSPNREGFNEKEEVAVTE